MSDDEKCSECGGYRMGEYIMHNDGCSKSSTTTGIAPDEVDTLQEYIDEHIKEIHTRSHNQAEKIENKLSELEKRLERSYTCPFDCEKAIEELKESLKSTDEWCKMLQETMVINKEVLREHLKAHKWVARDQLNPAINKEQLFKDFDNAIEKQLKKLDGKDGENRLNLETSIRTEKSMRGGTLADSTPSSPICEDCIHQLNLPKTKCDIDNCDLFSRWERKEPTRLCEFPNCDEFGTKRRNGRFLCEQHYIKEPTDIAGSARQTDEYKPIMIKEIDDYLEANGFSKVSKADLEEWNKGFGLYKIEKYLKEDADES